VRIKHKDSQEPGEKEHSLHLLLTGLRFEEYLLRSLLLNNDNNKDEANEKCSLIHYLLFKYKCVLAIWKNFM
jgi:hypothetical protein